jgi:hypothetical protein
VSVAERRYKARSRQGTLTAEQIKQLKSDLLALVDGRTNPKAVERLEDELVRFCGWDRHKIKGPRPYVEDCLESLENEGLIKSQVEEREDVEVRTETSHPLMRDPFPDRPRYSYWKVGE